MLRVLSRRDVRFVPVVRRERGRLTCEQGNGTHLVRKSPEGAFLPVLLNMRMKPPVRATSTVRAENLQRQDLAEREGFEPSVPGKGYARLATWLQAGNIWSSLRLVETDRPWRKYDRPHQ
jgi:hypothetical protein